MGEGKREEIKSFGRKLINILIILFIIMTVPKLVSLPNTIFNIFGIILLITSFYIIFKLIKNHYEKFN